MYPRYDHEAFEFLVSDISETTDFLLELKHGNLQYSLDLFEACINSRRQANQVEIRKLDCLLAR